METLLQRPFQKLPASVKVGVEIRTGETLLEPDSVDGPNAVYTTTVGVIAEHIARSNVPILAVRWVVEGYPHSTIVAYTTNLGLGQAANIPGTALSMNPLLFGWWKPNQYNVRCYIYTAYGTGMVLNTFEVNAPLVRDFNGFVGVTGVGLYQASPFLRLAESMGNFDRDGLRVNAVLAGNQSTAGTLAGIQLASNQRFCTHTDGTNWRFDTNGDYILDSGATNTVFYQNHFVPIGTDGANVNWDANDGPGAQLDSSTIRAMFVGDGDQTPHVPEKYRTFLMFRPTVTGSVWVPLKYVEWGWEGYTEYEHGQWTAAQDANQYLGNPEEPYFPEWNANTSQSHWVHY